MAIVLRQPLSREQPHTARPPPRRLDRTITVATSLTFIDLPSNATAMDKFKVHRFIASSLLRFAVSCSWRVAPICKRSLWIPGGCHHKTPSGTVARFAWLFDCERSVDGSGAHHHLCRNRSGHILQFAFHAVSPSARQPHFRSWALTTCDRCDRMSTVCFQRHLLASSSQPSARAAAFSQFALHVPSFSPTSHFYC